MKTRNFIILALLSINSICFSQVFSGYGIKAGMVSTYHSYEAVEFQNNRSTDSRKGITIGVFGEVLKIKSFSTIVEADFEQKGANFPSNIGSNYTTLDALTLELLPKLTIRAGFFSPYLSAGPRFDFVFGKNDKSYSEIYTNAQRTNFGISISAGTGIIISNKIQLIAETCFSPELTSYSADLFDPVLARVRYTNISWEFKLGLKFNH